MDSDRVVLITGATGDFGPYVAKAFAQTGARLALTARKLDQAQALASDLGLNDERALPAIVDVTQAESVAAWVAAVLARWGRVDVLVNVAGGYKPGALVADMAPTLARVVGVPPTERLDGRVLEQALVARVGP